MLGDAGLLDGRQCTTHWSRVDDLQHRFPRARVLTNRLFVEDGPIITSAGIVSGIDMALGLVEREHGPLVAVAAAREMVIYIRRDGSQRQHSVYLDYRTHLHPGVHRVQDWLIAHPEEGASLDKLARVAGLSPRHLTRVFRQATGVSIQEYRTRLRLERARSLLRDPGLTLEAIAVRCGFESSRQLRRIWKEAFGTPPSTARTGLA
jgi:transcriptional regulator GlxA family with amidase domain